MLFQEDQYPVEQAGRTGASSSNVYLAMASWAEVQGFEGVSNFLYKHSDEERMHMLKLMKFINERRTRVGTHLKAVQSSYKNVQQLFEQILEHEVGVSAEINKLVDECLKEKRLHHAQLPPVVRIRTDRGRAPCVRCSTS